MVLIGLTIFFKRWARQHFLSPSLYNTLPPLVGQPLVIRE
jgi:hypothetical protein